MPKNPPPLPDFESSLAELERIVTTMESGQIPLNEALASYQRGINLLRHCQQTLSSAEEQIRVLEQESLQGSAMPAAASAQDDE